MTNRVKRSLSLLLVFVLAGLLPMTAFAVNVSGTVYASSLNDNTDLILTGDTTLVMDVQKDLKSISGDYALTITGKEWLNVVNSGGHAISVKSLTSSASLYLDSSKDGLNIDGDILITAGDVIIDAGGDGIYSRNGSITIEGGIISSECGSNCAAIYAKTGNVNILAGDVTAKGDGEYGIYGNVIILRGTVDSFGLWGIRAEYNLSVSGGKTTATGGIPILSLGNITVDGDVTATQTIDGIEGADAICAEQNIIINSGTVTAETGSTNANAIESQYGNITVNGGLVIAKGMDKAICAEKGAIVTKGSINASKAVWGIWAEKDISIDGGFVYANGTACGIWSGGSISINGDVNSYGQIGAAILTEQKVTVNHGDILAVSIYENGIRGDQGIEFKDGRVRAEGGTDACYTKHGAITITPPLIVAYPNNGTIRSDGKVIVDNSGNGTQTATISKVYTVTFNANGHGTAPANQYVADGETLPFTPMSGVDGWTFGGWYKESACKNPFSYTSPIRGNLTLYAKWTSGRPVLSGTVRIAGGAKHYGDLLALEYTGDIAGIPSSKLHFEWQESNNKTSWTNILGEAGATYQTPESGDTMTYVRVRVTADGYDDAVYSDIRTVNPPRVVDTLKGSVTLLQDHASEAYFVIGKPITATAKNEAGYEMMMDGLMYRWQRRADTDAPWEYIPGATGKTYTPENADENCFIRAEVSYTQLLGDLYSSSKWVNWLDETYTVTFNTQGHGGTVAAQSVHRGSHAAKPADPGEAGWIFGGWFTDSKCQNEFDFDTQITENIKLYADWTKTDVFVLSGVEFSGKVSYNAGNYILDDKAAKCTWKNAKAPADSAVSFSCSHLYYDRSLTDKVHEAPVPNGIYYFECEIYNTARDDINIDFSGIDTANADLNIPGYSTACAKVAVSTDDMGFSRAKIVFELVKRSDYKYPITVIGGARAYSDKAKTHEITEAAEGDVVYAGYAEPSAGKYVTDLLYDGGSMDIFEYDGGITMPDRGISFEAVTADRMTYTVDLRGGSASIPDSVYVYNLPWGSSGFSLPTGTRDIDLDGSGKADITVTWNVSDPTAAAVKHPDCDITGVYTVNTAETNTPYRAVTYWFDASADPSNPFEDVKKGSFYYDAVLWAVDEDITRGTSATIFAPDATCTRGQVVTFLWRACGSPDPISGNNPFVDVKPDAYYYKAVLWAVEQGITKGTSATTFSPNQGCTRGQVVTFLHRFEGEPVPGSNVNPFGDVKTDAYYYDAVLWAVEKNITKGTSITSFSPNATCTRGQIVTFLYRDLARLNELNANDFLMYIEEVGSIPGRGVVVGGRITNGSVKKGDTLRLLTCDEDGHPVERIYGAASLTYDGKELDEASVEQNVYILIRGAKTKTEFQEGDVLVGEAVNVHPRPVYIGTLRLKATEEGGRHMPIYDGYQPNVWLGVGDVHAAVVGLALEGLSPGCSAHNVMLRFDMPSTAYIGQELVIREGGHTVGVFTVEAVEK